MPGAPGSLNVYLREGSAALVTQVCGGGAGEWAYSPGGGGSLAEAAACQASAAAPLALEVQPHVAGGAAGVGACEAEGGSEFSDDRWHFYLLSLACAEVGGVGCEARAPRRRPRCLQPHAPGLKPHAPSLQPHAPGLQPRVSRPATVRTQARVFVDGKLRASAAVGAPAGRTTGMYPAARPVVGGRADLGPNDFFGGLLANVSLRVESLPPTEAEVQAEWMLFWTESPCDPIGRPDAGAPWRWLAVALLAASLPVLVVLAVPRYRRQCASLCGLAPPPEESRCDGGQEDPSPARRLSKSNTFTSKVSVGSFEISCLPGGGGVSVPPRPQPRSSLALSTAGSGSNNFRVASSHRSVTIRSNREAAPSLL